MTPRRSLPGLRTRGDRYYLEVRHERLRGGRMVLSLRTTDYALAVEGYQAIHAVMDRGDWHVIERLRDGDLHISDVRAAVRDGRVRELRRVGRGPTLLGDAVEAFMSSTDATVGSPLTAKKYRVVLDGLLEHLGSDYPMEDLTRARAETFLHQPKATTDEVWAANTQRAARDVCRQLWDHAMGREEESARKKGLESRLRANPWEEARTRRVVPTRNVFLMPEEWLRLVERIRGTPHLGLLACAYRAGLRQQEIAHLRTDVDVLLDGDDPMIRVQPREGRFAWRPKHDNSRRDVPLTPDAVDLLREHREAFAGDRFFLRVSGADRPLSPATCVRWTEEAYARAGIKYGREGDGLTLHSGRHTYASWLAQQGVPLNIVADLLGNTMAVTYRTYAHLVPDTLRTSAMRGYDLLREHGLAPPDSNSSAIT